MSYTALISTTELASHLSDPCWVVVDCRFSLSDPERGERDYLQQHVTGAVYAHLDRDLSSPVVPGKSGRHPLPEVEPLAQTFGRWGIGLGVQVVVYDDVGGAIAARLWWLLRWTGHVAVAVLDGGWLAWRNAGLPVVGNASEASTPKKFLPDMRPQLLASAADVLDAHSDHEIQVLDARSADRFKGENETLDVVPGRIPGAISAPYTENLGNDGLFLPALTLRGKFEKLLGGPSDHKAIFYCGSGVTAAHSLVALAHAGMEDGRLYAGSWSEWITDPSRPVATG